MSAPSGTRRVKVTDLRPGDTIPAARGFSHTVASVTIRNGFSGPLSVRVEWRDLTEGRTYSPTARVNVWRESEECAFDPSGWVRMTTAEQEALVRPLYPAYLARRAELDAAGEYPYNESFVGRIDVPDGTTRKDEDTAIYLLQGLHRREHERALLAAFVAEGAREITVDDVPVNGALRGTVAVVGEYAGDTGYRVHKNVRVLRQGWRLVALPPRARSNGYALDGRAVYFLAGVAS